VARWAAVRRQHEHSGALWHDRAVVAATATTRHAAVPHDTTGRGAMGSSAMAMAGHTAARWLQQDTQQCDGETIHSGASWYDRVAVQRAAATVTTQHVAAPRSAMGSSVMAAA